MGEAQIYNLNGEMLIAGRYNPISRKSEFNLSSLPKRVYLIRLNNSAKTFKVVKE